MPKNEGAPHAGEEQGTHRLPLIATVVYSSASARMATAEAADEQGAVGFEAAPSVNCIETTPEKLLPAVQAAELFHRTTRTLRNWEARGLLPGVRIGRSLYFKLGDIERLIARGEAFWDRIPGLKVIVKRPGFAAC